VKSTDEVLTHREAAAFLKVSRNTMYALLRSGVISARKVGSDWRVMRSTLLKYVQDEGDRS
jgi:excisionase family DNA binding protein